jgi:uncharacterized damage-inducible protein DinB
MKDFFRTLFDYNYTVNQRLATVLSENPGKTSEKAVSLFSHILNAHQIWNNRVDPVQPPFAVWQYHSISDCSEIDKINYEHTLRILDNFEIETIITLPKIRGKIANKSVGDLLFHVINHASYHRGQIATEMRNSGLEPLLTDYFLFDKAL